MVHKVTPSALPRIFTQFQPLSKTTKVALAALGLFVIGLAVISYLNGRVVTDDTRPRDGDSACESDVDAAGDERPLVRMGRNGFPEEVNRCFGEEDYFRGEGTMELRNVGYTASDVTPEAISHAICTFMAQLQQLPSVVSGSDPLGNKFIHVNYGRKDGRDKNWHIVIFSMGKEWYIGEGSWQRDIQIQPFFDQEAAHLKRFLQALIEGSHEEYQLVSANPLPASRSSGAPDFPSYMYEIFGWDTVRSLPSFPMEETEGADLEEKVKRLVEGRSPNLHPIMQGVDDNGAPFIVFTYDEAVYAPIRNVRLGCLLIYFKDDKWIESGTITSENIQQTLQQLAQGNHPTLKLIRDPLGFVGR